MFLPSSCACVLWLAWGSIKARVMSWRTASLRSVTVFPPLPQAEVKQQEEPAGERTGGSRSAGGYPALSVEKVSGGW